MSVTSYESALIAERVRTIRDEARRAGGHDARILRALARRAERTSRARQLRVTWN